MLEKIFLHILNMSFTASFVILFVLMARQLLKKSPKILSYALWGVVLFRLICPFSFESMFSFLPAKTNPISQDIIYATIPTIDTGISAINHTVNQLLPAATPAASVNPLQIWVFIGTTVWLLGIAVLLIYSIISLVKLQKRLRRAVHERDNIYLAEHLDTPFVMGIVRPKIYLPTSLTEKEKGYILLHEEMHIRRFDHVVKILSFFVVCVHWFNPLVWVAFFVSGRDMEMSCDESVIKQLGSDVKKEYSSSLLTLATGRRIIGGTPLAFGEGDTRDRIKNVLNYKKPVFWMVGVAVMAAIIIAVGLLANPVNSVRLPDADDMNFSVEMLERVVYGTFITGDKLVDFPQAKTPEIADFIKNLRIGKKEVTKSRSADRDSTNQIHLAYEGSGNDGTIYNLYFNFNADFTEVWLNNEVKPGLSYQVRKPDEVKAFFERQFGSIAKAPEIVYAEELLWKARTKYIGDNSAVGKIISLLQLPEGVTYDGFKLKTSDHPYAITINLKTDTDTLNYYSDTLHQDPFIESAIIMFSLIENAELITFVFNDDINPKSFQLANGVASAYLGEDYFARTKTLEGFNIVLQEISEKVSANTEKIRKQKNDDALSFWVKPDEPPQVIGDTAAIIWLKSFVGAQVPAESRIYDYTITKVNVIAGEPKAGTQWEDMAYQYVVQIRYDITTATEEYFAPGDGVSGKGTFQGLFRELCVKAIDGGSYQIVSVGTGGGTQEFGELP